MILNDILNKKIAWKLLKQIGFRKRMGLKHDYDKRLPDGRRIHIQLKKSGKWIGHIDHH